MPPTLLTGYSAREVASLLGVEPDRVRYFVRAGLVRPQRGAGGEHRFTFQDLVLLRAAQGLLAGGVQPRRVRRALEQLQAQLPRGRSLSALRITADGGSVVARAGGHAWNPESGQGVLDFEVAALAEKAAPLAPRLVRDAARAEGELDADDWFALGCEVEATSPAEAERCYRRALELDARHHDALLNLGRLLHESGALPDAEACYRRALDLSPGDGVAAYNLGVALQDQGALEGAAEAYGIALAADGGNADACFNLAGVLEKLGRDGEAIRWLKEYRRLLGAR